MPAGVLNLGVIGCGKVFTDIHAPALRALAGAKIVAVADPVEEKRKRAGSRFECAVFADWRELLDQPAVDAVLICTPPADHLDCARQAFFRTKHVYLEKPLALNVTEGEAILRAWREAGTQGMIGFNYRFHPLYERARRLVAAGTLGKIVGIRSVFTSAGHWLHAWKRRRCSGGGALLDLATHHIDLVHFMLGQAIVEVSAELNSQNSEQDTAWLQGVLEGGATLQGFFSLHGTDAHRFEIYGTSANLTIDLYRPVFELDFCNTARASMSFGLALKTAMSRVQRVLTRGRDPSHQAALSRFLTAIVRSETSQPDLADGMRALHMVAAAERSAATGKPSVVHGVTVPES